MKSFAQMMMGEHHAPRVQGLALAKKLGVTPEAPADDPVKTAGESEMTALRSATKGAMFDSTYINKDEKIRMRRDDVAVVAYQVREELTVDGENVTLDTYGRDRKA